MLWTGRPQRRALGGSLGLAVPRSHRGPHGCSDGCPDGCPDCDTDGITHGCAIRIAKRNADGNTNCNSIWDSDGCPECDPHGRADGESVCSADSGAVGESKCQPDRRANCRARLHNPFSEGNAVYLLVPRLPIHQLSSTYCTTAQMILGKELFTK